jgi:hypothetical protein
MVILRATSILGGQNEDKRMMCSITQNKNPKKFMQLPLSYPLLFFTILFYWSIREAISIKRLL